MIYLDYSATTPCAPQVLAAMAPYFRDRFGNPSSSHAYGREARAAVEKAREQIAEFVGCSPGEIVFTSGATESNNLIFLSLLLDMNEKRRRIAISAIEHKSVLLPAKNLGNRGFDLTLLPVTSKGVVDVDAARELITEDTALVSVHTANNEIGTIQPINELAEIAHMVGAKFHTDAAQALGKMPFDLQQVDCDLASFSSHKIYGPKGIGALYIRGGTSNWPWDYPLYGGGQESGIKPGTHNVPAIVGFGEASNVMSHNHVHLLKKLLSFSLAFENMLTAQNSHYLIHCQESLRIGGLSSFYLNILKADLILESLADIAVSKSSACNSSTLEKSHVIQAIYSDSTLSDRTMRVSFGLETEESHVTELVSKLMKAIQIIHK
jgi:cysteine desulfurase